VVIGKVFTYLTIFMGMTSFVITIACCLFVLGMMRRSRVHTREMSLALAGYENKHVTQEVRALTGFDLSNRYATKPFRDKRMTTDTHPAALPVQAAAATRPKTSDSDPNISARAS
jgi:protein-disulfide isomerase-like protein with CxxC motif